MAALSIFPSTGTIFLKSFNTTSWPLLFCFQAPLLMMSLCPYKGYWSGPDLPQSIHLCSSNQTSFITNYFPFSLHCETTITPAFQLQTYFLSRLVQLIQQNLGTKSCSAGQFSIFVFLLVLFTKNNRMSDVYLHVFNKRVGAVVVGLKKINTPSSLSECIYKPSTDLLHCSSKLRQWLIDLCKLEVKLEV